MSKTYGRRTIFRKIMSRLKLMIRRWLEDRPDALLHFDYTEFENQFRGEFAGILAKQSQYVPMFPEDGPILDLGCGRGEFVEIMWRAGRNIQGVDSNPTSVAAAANRGVPVRVGDLFKTLEETPDGSLAGIFMSHVVEHVDHQQLMDLAALAARKMRPKGVFIAETPNPQCLLIFAESFYMDPTHLRPVHPLTLKFILEQAGFESVRFHHSSPASDYRLPNLRAAPGSVENLAEFNAAIDKLNHVFFGYRDYAVVATR